MVDPLIFISHINEEAELATIVRNALDSAFLSKVRFFQSSDLDSISGGRKWLDEVSAALRESEAILVLASQAAVRRPWINFEAGAGWVRDVPVIPLCHTDLDRGKLPVPMNMLQGYNASDETHLEHLVGTIAKLWGSRSPSLNYAGLASKVRDFEHRHGFVGRTATCVSTLLKVTGDALRDVFSSEASTRTVTIRDVPREAIVVMSPYLQQLQDDGLIRFQFEGGGLVFYAGAAPASVSHLRLEVLGAYGSIATLVSQALESES